jgi:N-acetyl-alpha-D-muramate 1-phosphate uridylyltransferase
MIEQVVILAGGLATRLYPVTKSIPKSMIDINGKPFIHHQLELLKKNSIKKVVICAGYLGDQIFDYVGNGNKWDIEIVFSYDGDKLLGTGGAVKKAYRMLDDFFFVMYGDSYLPIDFCDVAEFFEKDNKDSLMTVIQNGDLWDKSNVVFRNGEIVKYDKKDKNPDMKYIDYGLGIFNKKVFDNVSDNEVTDLADIYKRLLLNKRLLGYEVATRFYEIGSFKGIEELKLLLTEK